MPLMVLLEITQIQISNGTMDNIKLDKTMFEIQDLNDSKNDLAYWLSKSPEERIAAIEIMREINYDYNPATDRLQRIFEIVELL